MSGTNDFDLQRIHDQRLRESINVAATAAIISFDPEKMTANVQPLSKHLAHGKYESQPPILKVPVVCLRSGGFIFRPWLKEGDVGIVLYLDHDMDSTVASGKEAEPQTERNHSATDAIFIGGIVAGEYAVKDLPEEGHVLAKDDGSIFAAVTADKVIVKNSDTTGEFTADSINLKSQTINIEASGPVNIKGAAINLN